MPFWGSEKLRNKLDDLVTPSNPASVTQGSIELRMGREAFVTGRGGERIVLENDGEDFVIPPGQFGQLLTLERVNVPLEAIAFISIKFRHKLRGLVNVSGFHVDPGYNGWLVLSVYNAGAENIRLSKGQATFLIWYADLDSPMAEGDKYLGGRGQSERIPDEYIMQIDGDIASPGSLQKQMQGIEEKVRNNRFILGLIVVIVVGSFLVPALRAWTDGIFTRTKQIEDPERQATPNNSEHTGNQGPDGVSSKDS